jgi:Flp pilus assembly protein TadG
MMQRRWSQLATKKDGTTTIELAIVMMAMVMLMFGMVDFGRLLWTRQVVMHAADAAARCYSIGSPSCTPGNGVLPCLTSTNTPATYAVTVASNDGVTLSATNVTYTPTTRSCSTPCTVVGGSPKTYQISISYTFTSPVTTLLSLPTTFSVSSQYAC